MLEYLPWMVCAAPRGDVAAALRTPVRPTWDPDARGPDPRRRAAVDAAAHELVVDGLHEAVSRSPPGAVADVLVRPRATSPARAAMTRTFR
jgi:hypothetical protein